MWFTVWAATKEDRNPQQCIRYICKVLPLLLTSAEEYIVSPKTQNTWLKPEFRHTLLSVWQGIVFAEAPVEREDGITYFSFPAVVQRAVTKISNPLRGFTHNHNWALRLQQSSTYLCAFQVEVSVSTGDGILATFTLNAHGLLDCRK